MLEPFAYSYERRSASSWLSSLLIHVALGVLLAVISIPQARQAVTRRWTPLVAPRSPARAKIPRPVVRTVRPILYPAVPRVTIAAPALVEPEAPRASNLQIVRPPAPPLQQPIRPIPPPPTELVPQQERAAAVGSFGEVARAEVSNARPTLLEIGTFEARHGGTEKLAASQLAMGMAGFGDTQVSSSPPSAGSTAAAGAGFDAVRTAAAQSTRAQVASTGFDAVQASPSGVTRSRGPTSSGSSTPLEILDKPRPQYSAEARRMHIEGDVTVEALFEASGRIRILRVLRGLGHGLDENAVTSAGAIRFRPATREGRPIDTVGVVHIQFQLVY